jgi:hypothetical protein
MIRTLLMSVLLIGATSITLTNDRALPSLAADSNKFVDSPYEGRYRGPWISKTSSGDRHGEWILSINANGRVTGKEEDYRTTRTADLNGSISDDGEVRILCEYPNSTTTIKGTIVKTKSGHLKGTLAQYSGKELVSSFDIDLSPN